jgi:hypothetical protein
MKTKSSSLLQSLAYSFADWKRTNIHHNNKSKHPKREHMEIFASPFLLFQSDRLRCSRYNYGGMLVRNYYLFCYHGDMDLPPWWSHVPWLGTCICGPVISDKKPSPWQLTRATVRPVQWGEAGWHMNGNHCSSISVLAQLLEEHKANRNLTSEFR